MRQLFIPYLNRKSSIKCTFKLLLDIRKELAHSMEFPTSKTAFKQLQNFGSF